MGAAWITEVERGEVHTVFWCNHLDERDHLEEQDVEEKVILK
jgi:hypothetical protein